MLPLDFKILPTFPIVVVFPTPLTPDIRTALSFSFLLKKFKSVSNLIGAPIENKFKKIYIVSNKNENRSIKLSEKLVKFKSLLMNDQRQRLKDKSIDCEVVDVSEIKNIENYYGLYPTVGENLDYLNSNNLKIDFLYRNLDQLAWQYCNKGFFNFKNYIPKIISAFN